MTFDEFIGKNAHGATLRDIWNAATEAEREACAKVCDCTFAPAA